jgi:all-trans-8'-apo-beta-carotenal 15,15'-oxygenase
LESVDSSIVHHRDDYDRQAWINGWYTVEKEECYELDASLPKAISGTFFQNGPAKFQVGRDRVMHPFDGDGMIRAVTFENGRAWFRNRFVRTPGFVQERKANRILYRGVFGTAKKNGKWWANILDLRTKNLANTHVLFRNNRLYALWEAAKPTELNPCTLETNQESNDFGDRYAAHYKIDPKKRTICSFSIHFGWPDPRKTHELVVKEHDMNGDLMYERSTILPGIAIGHDMAITENYFCFLRAPTTFDPIPFLLGRKGPAQCFGFDDSGTPSTLYLVPRHGSTAEIVSINVPASFCFHLSNAFEDPETGYITIDAVQADDMLMADTCGSYPNKPIWETVNFDRDVPPYAMVRTVVDPVSRRLLSQTPLTKTAGTTVDFPIVHPDYVGQPYKYAFLATSSSSKRMGPLQGLLKMNVHEGSVMEKWLPEPHQFLSEASVIPRSSREEDVYLVGYLLDGKAQTSSLVVFDGENISQGPISMASLHQMMPHSLHGVFVPNFCPKLDERVRSSFQ